MFNEKNISEPTAFIHVDCDGISEVCGGLINCENKAVDTIFFTAIPRILEMFAKFNCKATFFAVARDLRDPEKVRLFRQILDGGHSIGSHSYSHPNLHTVNPKDLQNEIVNSKKIIEDVLGIEVSGFRAPGYTMNTKVLELLEKTDYKYDSSIFPNLYFAKSIGIPRVSPYPFMIGKNGELYEFPLPKYFMGFLPWHASYSMILGYPYYLFNHHIHRLKTNYFLCLYHLIDFSDPVPEKYLKNIKEKILSGSMFNWPRKKRICNKIISTICSYYKVMKTEDFLRLNLSPR